MDFLVKFWSPDHGGSNDTNISVVGEPRSYFVSVEHCDPETSTPNPDLIVIATPLECGSVNSTNLTGSQILH